MSELERIKQVIREMDDRLDEGDPTFKTAVVLLASSVVGPDEDKIIEMTGYDAEFVHERAVRLRENRVWQDDGKVHCQWMNPEHGDTAFWCDVLVAEGLAAAV